MSLAFDRTRTTHDVGARIDAGHGALSEAVQAIAGERGLPGTWLNEQATANMPKAPDTRARTVYDSPYLTITGASAEHILAMKLEAGRAADEDDIRTLIRHLRVRSIDEALAVHAGLFPESTRRTRARRILYAVLHGPGTEGRHATPRGDDGKS